MTQTYINYINKRGERMYEIIVGREDGMGWTEEEIDKKAKRFGWKKEYVTLKVYTSEELFKAQEEYNRAQKEEIIRQNESRLAYY